MGTQSATAKRDQYFLVYIVESPSANDLYHKRYEGEALCRALSLAQIPSEHRLVASKLALYASFKIGLKEVLDAHPDALPIVHLSAHGGEEGIQLTDDTLVRWDALRDLLMPINKALDGSLLLCMSACKGAAACRMAMDAGDLPFAAVVGNTGDPTWSDTTVAYASFYHLLKKGRSITDAIASMCHASGDPGFLLLVGAQSQQIFLEGLQKAPRSKLDAAVQAQALSSGVDTVQKALARK